MVMNRCHFENSFAVGDFEIADLDNVAHGFTNINDTYRKKKERTFDCIAECYDQSAEEKRACVAHKCFGRVPVPTKKAQNAAQKRTGENTEACKLHNNSGDDKCDSDSCGNRRAKSVDTVGKVNRIDATVNNENRNEPEYNGGEKIFFKIDIADKRNVPNGVV